MTPTQPPLIGTGQIPTPTEAEAHAPTEVQMRNVDFHIDTRAVLHIHELRGEMKSKTEAAPLNFDDKRSFVLHIARGKIGVDASTLDDLMNRYVFNFPGAPLTDLHSSIAGGHLVQEGVMHKVIAIPFTMTAEVSATKDGLLRIHPVSIRICSLNGLALLKAVGMTMEKMLDLRKASGVKAEKNDLLIDVKRILPPPEIAARLTSAEIDPGELLQVFDDGTSPAGLVPPDPDEPNYMYYRHGTLRMGKLLMVDADMEVNDTDRSDPFDFFIDRYNDQLVAGFSRNRADYGLSVFMRDWPDVGKPTREGERRAP